jgi:hypothetical protein
MHQWQDDWTNFMRGYFPRVMTENEIGIFTGFAAIFKHRQACSATCGSNYRIHLDVAVVGHSPRNEKSKVFGRTAQTVESNAYGSTVKMGQREEFVIEQRVWTTDIWCAMTSAVNRKSDTAMHQTLMQDIVSFYNDGHILHATKCHIDGEEVPSKGEVEGGAAALVELTLASLLLVHVYSDGCARQYAGRKNYLRVAGRSVFYCNGRTHDPTYCCGALLQASRTFGMGSERTQRRERRILFVNERQ